LADGRTSGYSCGEGVNDRGPALVLSHGGAVSGFVAQNTVIPATHSAVVLLSNTDFSPIGALNQELVAKLMPKSPDVPTIADDRARCGDQVPRELGRGTVDHATLGDDFNEFLSADKVRRGQAALNALGKIGNIRIAGTGERGGMEVATVLFDVGKTPSRGLMYRMPNGKIEEFLFARN
jgi:hypothetical protein